MKVLIAAFDLFRSVGGGQTFYRSVIERNPGVRFFYFREREPEGVPKPANAFPVNHRPHYGPHSLAGFAEPDAANAAVGDFLAANNLARAASACGHGFDLIDTPDYERLGPFLPGAMRRHGVEVGKVVVSLHGAISTTVALAWGGAGKKPKTTVALERLQYEAADGRYCISPAYRDEWAGYSRLTARYLDPMWFFTPPARRPYRPLPGPPTVLFAGRTDKGKGPHLFVHMVWWLPPDCYRDALVVGPEVTTADGRTSTALLHGMANARRIGHRVRIEGAKTPAELAELFATNVLPVVSSLHDTLNLVALEALFGGCPVVVSTGAGAVKYLRERFPAVPFVAFDLANFYAELPKVEDALRRYDDRRAELDRALAGVDFTPSTPPLSAIYEADAEPDPGGAGRGGRHGTVARRAVGNVAGVCDPGSVGSLRGR